MMNGIPRRFDMPLNRRDMLAASAAVAGASMVSTPKQAAAADTPASKGRVQQTVCQWCYKKVPLADLAKWCQELGLVGMDLIAPSDFSVLKEHGLVCSITPSHSIGKGLNDPANWEECLGKINEAIEATAAEGWKNVICFSGNRNGMADDVGLKNCAEALKKIVPVAEEKNVVIQMELLNSRVNHKDYMCDKSAWGIEVFGASLATTSTIFLACF